MIKSELVQRIASQNPHLYHQDAEKLVDAILGEIVLALARGDRVELRGQGDAPAPQPSSQLTIWR